MKKRTVFFVSFLIVSFHLPCNSQSKLIVTDSISVAFAKTNFNDLQVLQGQSPLVYFRNGIYMPYEKMWYYQLKNDYQLKSYAISHIDTSLYLIVQKSNKQKIVQLSKDASGKSLKSEISLEAGSHKLYPISKGNFYLVTFHYPEHGCTVKFFDGKNLKPIATINEEINKLIPIDNQSFIGIFDARAVLF